MNDTLLRLLASVYRVISKHLGDSRFSGIAATHIPLDSAAGSGRQEPVRARGRMIFQAGPLARFC